MSSKDSYYDVYMPDDDEIETQKDLRKGTMRHDAGISGKYHAMNIGNFDVYLPKGVKLDNKAYNSIKEHKRKKRDIEDNAGHGRKGRKGGKGGKGGKRGKSI